MSNVLEPTHNAPLALMEQQLARLLAAVDRLLTIEQDLRRQVQERDELIDAYATRLNEAIDHAEGGHHA